jgi:hypothetical protein
MVSGWRLTRLLGAAHGGVTAHHFPFEKEKVPVNNSNAEKIRKCFHLVSSMQTKPVGLALAPFGLTPEEIAKGQGLVIEAQRQATVGRPKVVRTAVW